MSAEYRYWPAAPTPIFEEPRWAVGINGPSVIIQGDEVDVRRIVEALNAFTVAS